MKSTIRPNRVEVLREDLGVVDAHPELLLEEADDLEHAGRVDDPAIEEGRVVAQRCRIGDVEVRRDEGLDPFVGAHPCFFLATTARA